MKRHIYRQNAMSIIYIYLMTQQDIDLIIEDNRFVSSIGSFIHPLEIDDELLDAIHRAIQRQTIYIPVINHHLKKWRFDRLGKLEQSILLLALSELEQGIQEKAIIVNEAVELAKEFCDDESYRLINGVLDAL